MHRGDALDVQPWKPCATDHVRRGVHGPDCECQLERVQRRHSRISRVQTSREWARRTRRRASTRNDSATTAQVLARIDALVDGKLAKQERGIARFLEGRVLFTQGDLAGAEKAFARALKDVGDEYKDDVTFSLIEAIEARGRDGEAAEVWQRWTKRYGQSALRAEAELRRVWNDIRRGESSDARQRLDVLRQKASWIADDPRVSLADAMLLFGEGKAEEALAQLGVRPEGIAATYLSALCHDATGARLRAAAAFQDVATRWPDAALADHARLAKADVFLTAGDFRSAAEAFDRVSARVHDPRVRAEAELRAAASRLLADDRESAVGELRELTSRHDGSPVAARAQFLLGEALALDLQWEKAIVEYNRVLTRYFEHGVAASAQYRVARALDALGRPADATGSYQAVVRGYPLEPEAPAAAYLAGLGLLGQGKARAAVPYFQLVLDRYASLSDSSHVLVFESPEHRDLVEASLCMLFHAYHESGSLAELSGTPHLLLQRMPPSHSRWRAHAMLYDADALAAQGRHDEALRMSEQLMSEFPDDPLGASATRLVAWIHSREGRDSLAIVTEERLLARYQGSADAEILSAAFIDIAHQRFNQRRYGEAAAAYADFLQRFASHPRRHEARYQAALCYLRLDRAGDAVDQLEAIVREAPGSAIAERAWARAGDVYFQAGSYDEARRAYHGLLEHFAESPARASAALRLAQCDYNAGRDEQALAGFAATMRDYPGSDAAREAERGTERTLYRLSENAEGVEVLARLVEQYPDGAFAAEAQFRIGRAHFEAKRYSEAASAFRRVVTQFPGYSAADQAQFLMADAYTQSGLPEEAQRSLEQFLAYFPASELVPAVSFRAGLLQFESGDYVSAGASFTRALTDTASREVRSAARFNLALCQRRIGDTQRALEELNRHAAEFPNDERSADVAFQMGDLYDAAGDAARAADAFERSLNSGAASQLAVEVQFRLGRVREALGDVEAALRAYSQAGRSKHKSDPYRLSALARSAELYESRNDASRALTAYKDIVRHADDQALVAAAADRVTKLESAGAGKR